MHDPHIDIDELDEIPASGKTGSAAEFSASSGSGRNLNPADLFMGVSSMLRNWQEQNLRFMPEETVKHLRASQREWLLAWRSLIDVALEKLETQETRAEIRREAHITDDKPTVRTRHKVIVEEFEG